MDASNIMKPALSRGEIQCIGATTLNEYRKYIEHDAALERRFQIVNVEAPSVDQAIQILQGLKQKYAEHHTADFTDEAIESSVRLSDRYLSGRHLPDKAIDLMDEAGSRANIEATTRPAHITALQGLLQELTKNKESAIRRQDFEGAAALLDQVTQTKEKLAIMLEGWRTTGQTKRVQVDVEDILDVVAKWTGIPLKTLKQDEIQKLMAMEEELSRVVIGQKEAVTALCKALRRARADLRDPKRPIGTFLLLGPTGVGKTLLCKTLAAQMFGDPKSLIQLDMSEYMEKFSVSRLVGAPPGYVGYEEGGQLTEQVRRKPYSVVLFDEIEKAHPDVMSLLLQILEEGKLTDNVGRVVDFRNTILLLTSNLGAENIRKLSTVGFASASEEESYEKMREQILHAVRKEIRPEFLNRLDHLIVCRSLTKADLIEILDLEVAQVVDRLKARKMQLTLEETAKNFLAEKGYDPTYGARPMRRAVTRYLADPLAEEILKGTFQEQSLILVTVDGDKLAFTRSERLAALSVLAPACEPPSRG
jgi:ATP-dependent Clp protease ATP-binding subunit ClpC